MNRLASAHGPFAKLAFSSAKFDHPADQTATTAFAPASRLGCVRTVTSKSPRDTALFAPIHYEPGYAYPLVVWLHGEGSSERELRQVMPRVSVRNYVGAAVRGTTAETDSTSRYTWSQSSDAVDAATDSVAQCIELAQRRRNIHPDRIFLAGRGAGGTMALRLALGFGLPVAGAISLGGSLPRGNGLLARINEARTLPLMLMTCRGSQAYQPRQVADDLRLLHAAGCQLTIHEYLCGDELYTDMFADIDQWLMAQVCGAPQAVTKRVTRRRA
jgi:phospholipase/carboxylesterase